MISPARWVAASDYPATTIPGLGMTRFSERLAELSIGRLQVDLQFEVGRGTTEILNDVSLGRTQIGDLYCAPLGSVEPIFSLASLPFVTTSIFQARSLLEIARTTYERRISQLGGRLLYVSPWPSTGLWSAVDIHSLEKFSRLRVRTYDDMSALVITAAGANAVSIPFGKIFEDLEAGRLHAVISSGDGEAGRRLQKYLPYFYNIQYATPNSFLVVNSAAYASLSSDLKAAVNQAALHTELELWGQISSRSERNRNEMIASGVSIRSDLIPEIRGVLNASARDAINGWKAATYPLGGTLLQMYLDSVNS